MLPQHSVLVLVSCKHVFLDSVLGTYPTLFFRRCYFFINDLIQTCTSHMFVFSLRAQTPPGISCHAFEFTAYLYCSNVFYRFFQFSDLFLCNMHTCRSKLHTGFELGYFACQESTNSSASVTPSFLNLLQTSFLFHFSFIAICSRHGDFADRR